MNASEQSAPAEIGLAEAANRIAGLSEGSTAQPEPKRREEAPAEAEEAEASAGYPDETLLEDGEALEAQAEGPSDDDAGETVEEGEEQAAQDLDPDTLVTVKIDGKTMQVKLKEALSGYQRLSDYSRKMEFLRQEKTAFEGERQQVVVERQQYGQLLNALQQQLQQLVPQEPNWEELHRNDPLNFPIVEKQWRDYKERMTAVQAEQQRLAMIAAQQETEQTRQLVDQGRNILLEKVPEWRDQAKWEKARVELRDYGRKIGYSDEELSQAYDPRAVLVLDKARRYDALMANRPKPQVQGQNAPKPLRAGSTASSPRQAPQISRMRERLKQSGSVDDAAALFGLLSNRK